jgi:arylformamidase
MNKPIFLSHFLTSSTPGYGGKSAFAILHTSKISDGATSNSQEWKLSNHIGTHIDLPAHFDDSGERLDSFKCQEWIFSHPYLLDLEVKENEIIEINLKFNNIPIDTDFLIIKTGFQKHREEDIYWKSNPGLSPDLASWLRENRPQLKCLGFDFISITSFNNRPLGRIAHKAFLGSDQKTTPIRVIEDMKLDELYSTPKKIIVAPILVSQADGAPVTVISFPE